MHSFNKCIKYTNCDFSLLCASHEWCFLLLYQYRLFKISHLLCFMLGCCFRRQLPNSEAAYYSRFCSRAYFILYQVFSLKSTFPSSEAPPPLSMCSLSRTCNPTLVGRVGYVFEVMIYLLLMTSKTIL